MPNPVGPIGEPDDDLKSPSAHWSEEHQCDESKQEIRPRRERDSVRPAGGEERAERQYSTSFITSEDAWPTGESR